MDDDGEGWQSTHFNQRHMSVRTGGKGSSRKGGAGNKSVFMASSSYGLYEVGCPALAKLAMGPLVTSGITGGSVADSPRSASFGSTVDVPPSPGGSRRIKKGRGNSRRESKEDRIVDMAGKGIGEAKLEIHGDVEGEENEGALMCSFDLGGMIQGVAVLAGSRRLIKKVVAELDGEEDDDEGRAGSEDFEADSVASTTGGYGSEDEIPVANDIELADERERKKIAAFEKNSFRVPKFWMRWRGYVSANAGTIANEDLQRSKSGRIVEVNTGYLVFSGNNCSTFSGTFTCQALGWKNVKITGTKLVSKARECPLEWSDVVASD